MGQDRLVGEVAKLDGKQIFYVFEVCNIFSTIHICAYLPRPSGLIGTIT